METAPNVANQLLNPLAGESDVVKGSRIIQKGNNSAKAVVIDSQERGHTADLRCKATANVMSRLQADFA